MAETASEFINEMAQTLPSGHNRFTLSINNLSSTISVSSLQYPVSRVRLNSISRGSIFQPVNIDIKVEPYQGWDRIRCEIGAEK